MFTDEEKEALYTAALTYKKRLETDTDIFKDYFRQVKQADQNALRFYQFCRDESEKKKKTVDALESALAKLCALPENIDDNLDQEKKRP